MKQYLFKSERLGFRNWLSEDVAPYSLMNKDEQVMEFFPNVLTEEETAISVDKFSKHFEENGFTFFAVDTLDNGEFIGFIGIVRTSFEEYFTPCVEIGWRLKTAAWGKGYATEGALRCLEHGFTTLGFKEIYSFTPLVNKRSERVMTKIGMKRFGEFNHPKLEKGHDLEQHTLYKIK